MQIETLANILKCKVDELLTVYLGMSLGSKHKAIEIWDGITEKSEKKLAIWKSQYLSLGGRVTLINSVLGSMRTWRRNFLWQGNKIEKGFNLAK